MSVKPGQSLGPYRIIEQIGKGGMATVYRGTQPSLSRQVAIKILPEFFAEDSSLLERFRQEATSIAGLRHPNILTVFDSGEADGVPYMVTELVEGGTLSRRLGKPLDIEECLRIARAVASALDYAHSKGMVHRDVKPSNILIASDGTPILSDFGLALMLGPSSEDAATRLTMSGTTLGTAEYMAPEQVSNSNVGPSADIYALAVIIYEMLTGGVPYSAETQLGVLMARINQPVPLPRERNQNISEPVQDALLKGLAKNPADRYQRATDMIRALESATQSGAVPERQPTSAVTEPARTGTGRRKAILAVIMSAPVIAIIVVILLSKTYPAPPKPPGSPAAPAAPGAAPTDSSAAPVVQSIRPETAPAEAAKSAIPVPTSAAANADRAQRSAGLPPHGRLLYSMSEHLTEIAASPQRDLDKIQVTGDSVEITAATDMGFRAALPVNGVGDFVAVMKYVSVSRRPLLRLRFHETPRGESVVVRIPAFLHLKPPVDGAPPTGPHVCCQDFDMFVGPQTPGSPAIFTGPPLLLTPAEPNEEQTVAISVKSSTIVVYADGHEIARASENTTAPGGMSIVLQTDRGQGPAVLRLNALEIYDAQPAPTTARNPNSAAGRLPPHGKVLYSTNSNPSDLVPVRQTPENTFTLRDGKFEFTAGNVTGVFATLPINGIGDFVAVMRMRAVTRKPVLMFRFHRSGPTGEYVVQLPAYLRLLPPPAGAQSPGPHPCCQDFDIFKAPTSTGALTLYTGPPLVSAAAAANEEVEFAISVKGPLIVVYAEGQEIGRASDSSFVSGALNLQVVARGREDQYPAVLQLNALEIYEPAPSR